MHSGRLARSIPSRCAEHLRLIDALGEDDRADCVVEIEVIAADQPDQIGRQRVGGQRAGGDDYRLTVGRFGDRRDFVAHNRDERMVLQRRRDRRGETFAIHRERGAGRHARLVGSAHDQRPEPPHLLLQETDGVIQLVTAE